MQIFSKSQWDSRYNRPPERLGLGIKEIFIHTFAVNYSKESFEDSTRHLRNVERYHVRTNGWQSIGYSWMIDPSGRIFEGRGVKAIGAHTAGHNRTAYGIALFGHGDEQSATSGQIEAVKKLIQWLVDQDLVAEGYRVRGHREVSTKSCPGNLIYPLVTDGTWAGFTKEAQPFTKEAQPLANEEPKSGAVLELQRLYLDTFGRWASEADETYWLDDFDGEYSEAHKHIISSQEAFTYSDNAMWLDRITREMGLNPVTVRSDLILERLEKEKINRSFVVDSFLVRSMFHG